MELTLEKALERGVEAQKAGHIQEADKLYTAILRVQPKHPIANHNFGVLAVGIGKVVDALPFFKTALESNSSVPQFWFSYIDALIKLNRLAEAKATYDWARDKEVEQETLNELERRLNAFKNQEPSTESLQSLADHYNGGQLQIALEKGIELLKQFPNSVTISNINSTIYNKIGISFQEQGKSQEAIEAYNNALTLRNEYPEVYSNLSNVLLEQGKLDECIEACKKALSIKPDYASAYNNMGLVFKKQGKLEMAIDSYKSALKIKPNFFEANYNMAITLKSVTLKEADLELQKIITSMLENKKCVRPSDIFRAAITLLNFEAVTSSLFEKHANGDLKKLLREVISDLCKLPLLLKLMSVCPIADSKFEKLLKEVRSSLLLAIFDFRASREVLRFQTALALQCLINEFIYDQSDDEVETLHALETLVAQGLANGKQPSSQHILCLASYKELQKYKWYDLLTVTDEIREVFARHILEPMQENNLVSKIPVLEEITDTVSSKVRAQYELYPYPRWVNLALPPTSMDVSKIINSLNLRIFDSSICKVKSTSILVAGCGTGQHSIDVAGTFKNSKVLAIDLSLSSLAYAKRKTEELDIQNIDYMQADILNLRKLNRQFDIIESGGVLHHMDNPMVGWRVLTDCLKKGGLMKIGLYSDLARRHIAEIRNEIKELGIENSDLEMILFRNRIINSGKEHHKKIRYSRDFYSLSTMRDLLFHVQEYRFTLPKVKACLSELGLKFCGFSTGDIVQKFNSKNNTLDAIYDLDKWSNYEESNPDTFAQMYQFWCQKIG